jgi:hypothetical protein
MYSPIQTPSIVTHILGDYFADLKVLKQQRLVLLINVRCTGGKALGSEEGKALGSGICYEHRKEF